MANERQYIIAPRNRSTAVERTKETIGKAETAGVMRLLEIHPRTGIAKVEMPEDKLDAAREMLGAEFMIDVNSELKF